MTNHPYLEASCKVAMEMICGWKAFTSSSGDTRGVSGNSREGRCSGSSEDTHLGVFSQRRCCLGLRCLGQTSSEPSSSSFVDKHTHAQKSLFCQSKYLMKMINHIRAEHRITCPAFTELIQFFWPVVIIWDNWYLSQLATYDRHQLTPNTSFRGTAFILLAEPQVF